MSQKDKLIELLSDGKAHRTDQIMRVVYGGDHLGLARVGARIYDIKQVKKVEIESWPDADNRALHWYRMKVGQEYSEDAFIEALKWASRNLMSLPSDLIQNLQKLDRLKKLGWKDQTENLKKGIFDRVNELIARN